MDNNTCTLSDQEIKSEDVKLSEERSNKLDAEYSEESIPLRRDIEPPKPFPFEALGNVLGSAAKRIHEVVKAPDSICGQSILAAAALTTQAYADVHIDGRTVPLSLFAITAAESGARKSAVDKIVLKPLFEYEKMLVASCKEEKRAYKNKLEAWKKERDEVMKSTDLNNLESALNQMSIEPQRPLEPHLLLEEPSYEGLVKLFAVGQPSLGLFSDEGGRMLGGYSMGKDQQLATACGLSSLWDGKPISRIRGGDENLILYGRRFSSHLMIQENVLASLLKNELLMGQGLIARCLIVAPVTNAGDRPYDSTDILQDPALRKYYNLISSILDEPFNLNDPEIQNELSPKPLHLFPDAKKDWVFFHDEIDKAVKEDGIFYSIRRMANKAPEQALRIAGILSLIESKNAVTISLEVMERAIVLVRFYLDEILRVTDMESEDPDIVLAEKTLNWMKKKVSMEGLFKTFSLKEIYQKGGPRKIRNVDAAKKIMKILEEHRQIERTHQTNLIWRLR